MSVDPILGVESVGREPDLTSEEAQSFWRKKRAVALWLAKKAIIAWSLFSDAA